MGREVRRVPANWQHPTDEEGNYIPLESHFPYTPEEVEEGLHDGWLSGEPPNYGIPLMPQWTPEEATHYQMYENTSEGTPISPVFETTEELAHWLADTGASACADMTASYEAWLRICYGGYAPSMVMTGGRILSGVEALYEIKQEA